MRNVKEKLSKNCGCYQFEIFGYDFMLDADFNLFLIEINDDPGIEESSPWISIIIPRMLDDALRLTIDQLFNPVYDFSKNYKKNKDEAKLKRISENFKKDIKDNNKIIKTEDNIDKNNKNEDNKKERIFTENNVNSKLLKNSKEIGKDDINKNNYISPFPVPGYKNDDNLWEFVCDLKEEDPLDINLDKKSSEKNKYYTGIKYLYSKKKS